jgi:hypothetical protein
MNNINTILIFTAEIYRWETTGMELCTMPIFQAARSYYILLEFDWFMAGLWRLIPLHITA